MSSVFIREAVISDAGAIARVHIESWRTTYPGIVPDEFLASLDAKDREARWRTQLTGNQTFTYVAESRRGEIAGFATGGPERTCDTLYRGELQVLYVLESHQRNGIGRRLTAAIAGRLLDEGIRSMMVWVLTENMQARRFYEALGGETLGDQPISIGGTELVEVAYGWPDIDRLADMSG